jgi:hypothetical protein
MPGRNRFNAKFIHATRLTATTLLLATPHAHADTAVNAATQNEAAFAKYGLTGTGVVVAILDRGLDYTHPDFRNANGTTRIRMMWDMSNANPDLGLCDPGQPAPVVYTQAQINQALQSGTPLGERDAVGHGTVTTGLAAGNGRAALPKSLQWAGMAPEADLVIVKMVSEGAPAHSGQPAEEGFQGCMNRALDLASQEAATLGEPIVALMDSGTQWGPIDGTSAVSARIAADFSGPGQVYVAASGDEGILPNHARATYSHAKPAAFPFTRSGTDPVYFQLWSTGSVPADVTLTMNDTATSVTAPPNACVSSPDASITLCHYLPGQQFYPWTSSGPDSAVWFNIIGHSGPGSITIQATGGGVGTADAYGDANSPVPMIAYTSHLTTGRLTDYASTPAAIVDGCFNVRTRWTDIDNNPESLTDQGATGQVWTYSSGGPTRDGRSPVAATYGGIDITTPGGNAFAAYSPTSYWGDRSLFPFNLAQGGNGAYGRHSATSASAPIAVGAIALLLQMKPTLTVAQVRQFLHRSAASDRDTGTTPNLNWGTGKLNLLAAADLVAATLDTAPKLSATSLTFPSQPVGTTSPVQTVTFQNESSATDRLGITSVSASGDFHVASNNCRTGLAPGATCKIGIDFKPTATGARTGTLTIKEFNPAGPATVTLSGSGS